ncbi:MAG: 4Fe-4S binding protein [Crocinitomicaceae bacterium]|nr:4Fe-4S binding protein [Crocinitomicaceae bacterium]
MKSIRNIGLVLFLVGFSIFIASLFIGKYSISEERLITLYDSTEEIDKGDTIVASLTKAAAEMGLIDKEFASQFTFSSKLTELFKKSNEFIANQFIVSDGITEEEKEDLIQISIESSRVVYSESSVSVVFPENKKKQKLVIDNTSWMFLENKEYETAADFKNDLGNKVNEINGKLGQEYFIWDNKYSRFDFVKASLIGPVSDRKGLFLLLTFGLCIIGSLMHILPGVVLMGGPGIKNDGIYHDASTNRGWIGILAFGFLFFFYVLLYFYPWLIVNWTSIVDPIKGLFVEGAVASQWFLYGLLYCVAMIVMGIRMFVKYRNNRYQIIRTCSVLFFQIVFAFLLVEILPLFDLPAMDLKNAWPLDFDMFFDWNVKGHLDSGTVGIFMFVWGIVLSVIVIPVMVYFYGKRWYCSWVCGCGGLAETLGDPYRQLSDKRLIAWKIERWMIYSVLVFAIIMTAFTGYHSYNEVINPNMAGSKDVLFGLSAYNIREWYGFLIGSIFAGVIGTGFYPILGNRAWCRFGCPLAAYMGLVQRFKSKFRITTNGGQCISCGNCSTYCEQGIDVRSYAQKGQNIVRASCVGCGVCSAVCPRGVLKLENGPNDNWSRVEEPVIIIGNDGMLEVSRIAPEVSEQ